MRGALIAATIAIFSLSVAADSALAEGKITSRKDPENRKGISPYMEAVVKGEWAFVARDMAGAKAAFQDAIKLDAGKSLAIYRLAEVFMDQGQLDDAEASLTSAVGKQGTPEDAAKVLFLTAELRERQHKLQAAKDAWTAYQNYLNANPKVKGHPATAADRIKRADQRMKDEVDYGAVKDRIEKRRQELEKEAQENAKKDKLNR